MTPIEIEMNKRKTLISTIIVDAKNNQTISYEGVIKTFSTFQQELEIYKYSGDNTEFKTALTDEYNNNTHNLQEFLKTEIPGTGIDIYQFLIIKIV